MFYMLLYACHFYMPNIKNIQLPAPTGTTVFHFALISLAIFKLIPLWTFRFRLPWRGCSTFLKVWISPQVLHDVSGILWNRDRQIHRTNQHEQEWALSRMQHMFEIFWRLSSAVLCYLNTNSGVLVVAVLAIVKKNHIHFHSRSQMNKTAEPLRLAPLFTTRARGWNELFLDVHSLIWQYLDVRLNHPDWLQSLRSACDVWNAFNVYNFTRSCHCLALSGKGRKCTIWKTSLKLRTVDSVYWSLLAK